MLLVFHTADARKTGKFKRRLHLRNSVSTTKMPTAAAMRAMAPWVPTKPRQVQQGLRAVVFLPNGIE